VHCIATVTCGYSKRERERDTHTHTHTWHWSKRKEGSGKQQPAAMASFSCPQLPLSSSVFWVFCETTQTSPLPTKKRVFFFCCKNTCHYLNKQTNISFPSFSLSLSLCVCVCLSPPKQGKGPPKFLGQFPKSQCPPKK